MEKSRMFPKCENPYCRYSTVEGAKLCRRCFDEQDAAFDAERRAWNINQRRAEKQDA